MKFGFDWPSGFRGEDLCARWTDGWMPEHGHPIISSPFEPSAKNSGSIILQLTVVAVGSCLDQSIFGLLN